LLKSNENEQSNDLLFTDLVGNYYNIKPDPLEDNPPRPLIPNGSISGVFGLSQDKSDARNPYRALRWDNIEKLARSSNSVPTPVTQSVGPINVRVHQSQNLSLAGVPVVAPVLTTLDGKRTGPIATKLYDKPRRTRVPKKLLSSDASDTDEEEGSINRNASSAEDKIIPEAEVPKYIKELGKKYGYNFVKAGGKVMGAHADRKSLDLKVRWYLCNLIRKCWLDSLQPKFKNKTKNGTGGTKRELLWTQKYVCSYTGQKRQKTGNGSTPAGFEPGSDDNFEDGSVGQKRKRGKAKWLCESRVIVSVYADKRDEAVVREYHDHSSHAGDTTN
jgi:hypothetical protein